MIGCLRARVRKQPIIALYFEFEISCRQADSHCALFEFENELMFYNLKACFEGPSDYTYKRETDSVVSL